MLLLLTVVSWPWVLQGRLPGVGGVMEGVEVMGLGPIPVLWLPGPMSCPLPHTDCSPENTHTH